MKKITLFSFFKSLNIGDILIADKVSHLFSNKFDCIFCDITSSELVNVEEWYKQKLLPQPYSLKSKNTFKHKLLSLPIVGNIIRAYSASRSKTHIIAAENCKESEWAVFAGGNSIMDLNPLTGQTRISLKRAKILKNRGIKIAYCYCGVGPFASKRGWKKAKKLISLVDFISVRDSASYEIVKKMHPRKEVEIWRDPVLLTDPIEQEKTSNFAIGVNVYFGDDSRKHKRTEKAFVNLISKLLDELPEYKIKLFSSEITDINHIQKVKSHFWCNERVCVSNIKSSVELFDFYRGIDAIVGTRMHTLITSLVASIPSVALVWQPKVKSLVEFFENERYCFDIYSIIENMDEVSNACVLCLERKEIIVKQNNEKLFFLREQAKSQLNNLLRM